MAVVVMVLMVVLWNQWADRPRVGDALACGPLGAGRLRAGGTRRGLAARRNWSCGECAACSCESMND